MSESKRIGIFAGTFDPIHTGHLAFARAGLEAGLEKVMFLVEPRPRHKQGVRDLEHRIEMVQLAIEQEPRFGTIILEQARFTPHETLPILRERFQDYELVLLFGDDVIAYMAEHVADWPHIDELARSSSLLIAARHHNQTQLDETLTLLKTQYQLPFRYSFVEPKQTSVSSSVIRLAVKHGEPVEGLPKSVAAYIQQQKLYGSSGSSK